MQIVDGPSQGNCFLAGSISGRLGCQEIGSQLLRHCPLAVRALPSATLMLLMLAGMDLNEALLLAHGDVVALHPSIVDQGRAPLQRVGAVADSFKSGIGCSTLNANSVGQLLEPIALDISRLLLHLQVRTQFQCALVGKTGLHRNGLNSLDRQLRRLLRDTELPPQGVYALLRLVNLKRVLLQNISQAHMKRDPGLHHDSSAKRLQNAQMS
mmetsp:Transcript_8106/g.17121  ORF Transcript_8106/g.17121 Transcript_8106/m.17121 type:complete len:211 (+) Transcript_8106:2207-2839(+)